ncbi:MAG: thiamine pyrophosphate-dependent dehydrogenase E1 component subunit alpha [bacterium]|jgi:TPP-dependent pyruvate/acetoin dehydrogenase alpha subunit
MAKKDTGDTAVKEPVEAATLGGPYRDSFKLTPKRKEQLRGLYRVMRLTRDIDDRMRKLFRQGRYYGTYFSQIGQECTTTVPAFLAEKDDFIGPSHRELGCMVGKGVPTKYLFAQVYTKSTSQDRGVMHPVFFGWTDVRQITPCTCLATQVPLATGAALSYKMRGIKNVAFCFTGEGATSKGDFHESLNFCGIHRLPLVYTIQNNWYAESVPLEIQSGNPNQEQRAEGYGIEGVRVSDGNDAIWMLCVYEEAIERARNGGGPTLIMADTYRWYGHSEIDPATYRPDDELKRWMALDPIPRFEAYLLENKVMTSDEMNAIKAEIQAEIEDAVKFAEDSPESPAEVCLENVYAPDDFVNPLSEFDKVVAKEI